MAKEETNIISGLILEQFFKSILVKLDIILSIRQKQTKAFYKKYNEKI